MAFLQGFDIYQFIGLIGVVLYIFNYALLQMGYLRGNGFSYPFLTLIAAACILISTINAFNLSTAVINATYIAISIFGLLRLYLIDGRVRFSADEQEVIAMHFPNISKPVARRFFDSGHWVEAEVGSLLTNQNEAVRNLIYLKHGGADVIVEERVVGQCSAGSFVGEITALTGAPATATTVLNARSEFFSISAEKLREMSKRDSELRAALDVAFSADMRAKLMYSNNSRVASTAVD